MPINFNNVLNNALKADNDEDFTNFDGLEKDPDSYAKTVKIADEAGLPPELVEGDEKQVESDNKKKTALDWYKLEDESPNLFNMMKSARFMSQGHDDIPQLSAFEKLFYHGEKVKKGITEPFENLSKTVPLNFANAFAGAKTALLENKYDPINPNMIGVMDFETIDAVNKIEEERRQYRMQQASELIEEIYQRNVLIEDLTPKDLNFFQSSLRMAADSLSYMVPALAVGAVTRTGAAGTLATIGAVTFSDSYGSARSKGLEPNEAMLYATVQSTIEVGTELIPVGTLMKLYSNKTGLGKSVIQFMKQEMSTEQLATIGNSITDYIAGLDPEMENATTAEKIAIQTRRQALTALSTFWSGGALAGSAATINKAVNLTLNEEQVREQKSRQDQQHIDNVAVAAGKSKLKKRNSGEFKNFVENAAKDEVVYIDGPQAALYLQGKDVKTDQVLSTISEQVQEASATNGEVMIPVADFAADIVGSEHFEALRPHMTMDSEAISPFRQENEKPERENYVQSFIKKANKDVETLDESTKIFDETVEQLINTGQVTAKTARQMGKIVPAWAGVKSKESGIPIQELYEKIGLKIEGPFEERKTKLANPEILEQFAGEKAQNSDKSALAKAVLLDNNGFNSEDIRKATGWFKGVDKQWRFEIDDSKTQIKKPFPSKNQKFGNMLAAFDNLKMRNNQPVGLKLDEILDAPDLFAAYPDLKTLDVSSKKGKGASFHRKSNEPNFIEIGEDAAMSEVKSMLSHELQHAIQEVEGFARGGSIQTITKDQFRKDAVDLMDRLVQRSEQHIQNMNADEASKVQKQINNLRKKATYDAYKRLAGEIEAREVQSRLDLTPEQRANLKPFADVKVDEAIVKFNQETRGYYDPQNTLIRLNEASDASTFMHEFAHFMLDMEFKFEGSQMKGINDWFTVNTEDIVNEANEFMREELAALRMKDSNKHTRMTVLKEVIDSGGVTAEHVKGFINKDITKGVQFDSINRATHEQFARAFEVYLMEGKAPSQKLREMFREMARMIVAVYKNLQQGFDAPHVDDEMRRVFDRLLASEEEIQHVEVSSGYAPLFTDAAMAGMTEKQYKKYLKDQEKPNKKAVESLRDRLIKELTRYKKAEWKQELEQLQEEKIEEVSQQRVHLTREKLKTDEFKLDRSDVKEMLQAKRLPKQLDNMTTTEQREIYNPGVKHLANDLTEGGDIAYITDEHDRIIGRTPSINPDWYKDGSFIVLSVDGKKEIKTPSVKIVKKAADKYEKREKLSASQSRIIEALSDVLEQQKEESRRGLSDTEQEYQVQLENLLTRARAAELDDKVQSALDNGNIETIEDIKEYSELIKQKAVKNITSDDIESNHPDDIAPIFGYESGIEMLNDVINAPTINQTAYDMAYAQMIAKHGDVLNDGSIREEAEKEAKNEERAKALLREIKILSKEITVPAIDRGTLQFIANQNIGKLRYADIRPDRYRKAEIRSAQEAAVHINNGNREAALRAKTQQVMNFYLWREAKIARDATDKIITYINKFDDKKVEQRIALAGNEYWDQIQSIRNRFEFRKSVSLKSHKTGIEAWAAQRSVDMDNIQLSDEVLDENYRLHWREISFDELVGIANSIKSIEHNARSLNNILIAEEKHTFEQAVSKMLESMSRVKSTFTPQRTTEKSNSKALLAENTKIAWMMSWLDNNERIGVMHDSVFQPTTDAMHDKMMIWKPINKIITSAIENRSKEDKKRHATKIHIPEIENEGTENRAANDGILEGHRILAVALNVGTLSNLRKLLIGEGWARDDSEVSLDNPRLQAILKHMTDSDWDLVETVWEQINSLFPRLSEVHEKSSGLPLKKVEGVEFTTSTGRVVQGMYYPMHYDPNRSLNARANALKANEEVLSMMNGTGMVMPSASTGARIERTGYTGPVALDLNIIPQHIEEVIHFITHYEPIKQINKLLGDPRIASTIIEKMGLEEYDNLKPWLNSIAKDGRAAESKLAFEKVADRMRFGATLGIMGYKASTTIAQTAGLFNTMAEVGVLPVLKAEGKLGIAPIYRAIRNIFSSEKQIDEHVQYAIENSKVLDHRMQTYDRDFRNAATNLKKKKGTKYRKVQELSLHLIGVVQFLVVDIPSWYAAVDKGMKVYEGDQAKAFKYADWVLEQVQGSGAVKDMSKIMASNNPFTRLFTMFMTFWSAQFNANRDAVRQWRADQITAADMAGKFVLMWVLPIIFEELVRNGLGEDEDDQEAALERMLINTALVPLQGSPLTRLASPLFNEYRANSSPVISLYEQGVDAVSTGNVKAVSKLVGAYYGVPGVNQAWLTGEHLTEVMLEGEELTIRELLYGPKR